METGAYSALGYKKAEFTYSGRKRQKKEILQKISISDLCRILKKSQK